MSSSVETILMVRVCRTALCTALWARFLPRQARASTVGAADDAVSNQHLFVICTIV